MRNISRPVAHETMAPEAGRPCEGCSVDAIYGSEAAAKVLHSNAYYTHTLMHSVNRVSIEVLFRLCWFIFWFSCLVLLWFSLVQLWFSSY